jgi:segregation and condensation protein B
MSRKNKSKQMLEGEGVESAEGAEGAASAEVADAALAGDAVTGDEAGAAAVAAADGGGEAAVTAEAPDDATEAEPAEAGEALYDTSSLEAATDDMSEGAEFEAAAGGADGASGLEGATLDIELIKRVLETALLTSPEPLSLNEMKRMFPRGETNNELMRKLLDEIRVSWEGRGVELVNVASGWRFRSRPELQHYLDKLNPQKAPKYSRAVMETLAIIAYRQPVTRGDIEDIRGVVVTSNIMKSLEARGWIDVIGHREVPGRPAIYATTKQFLDDLSLRSLEELPTLEDLGALVDASGAAQMEMNMPEHSSGASVSVAEGLMDDDDLDEELGDAAMPGSTPDSEIPPPSQLH